MQVLGLFLQVWKRAYTLDVMPWLILFIPLGGFIVLATFGRGIRRDREETGAGILACVAVFASFVAAVLTAMLLTDLGWEMTKGRLQSGLESRPAPYAPYQPGLLGTPDELENPSKLRSGTTSWVEWIGVGGLRVYFSLLTDRLSSLMTLIVTGIGFLIHVYSLGYMAHDEDRVRYFSYLNLFTFFMLLLVLAGSLPLMFVGWEGVGLCSYLLIGFWFKKKSASDAGKKAFIVNRIGDAGLILGTILAFHTFGTVSLFDLTERAQSLPREGEPGAVTLVCLLLFLGACGKSAQFPLHVWLPDAMEGPTPVSALIHAATMVTAGVYVVARLAAFFSLSPLALTVVAVVGAFTAFFAATIALVQTDIKRVLAYSTLSQLGYMFLACGVGAFGAAVFHLFTHAFFKALLFLGSGSVIHALGGEQDMRKMGGLREKIPLTYFTFLAGAVAIAGIPPLAGYYSKDAILGSTLGAGHPVLFVSGLITALLTAFYMARLVFMTFHGTYRGDDEHVHESPWIMLVPLLVLAAGSIAAGWISIPLLLEPVLRVKAPHEHFGWLGLVTAMTAVVGGAGAFYLYVVYVDLPGRLRALFPGLFGVLEAKYGVDDFYNWIARRVFVEGGTRVLWKGLDAGIIDGAVNLTGEITEALAGGARLLQTGLVREYVLAILLGAVGLLSYLLWFT